MTMPVTVVSIIALLVLLGVFLVGRKGNTVPREPIGSILDLAAIPPLRQAVSDFSLEIARARRLSHPLSLVVVRSEFIADSGQQAVPRIATLKQDQAVAAQARQLNLEEFSECSRAFRNQLREVDRVAFDSVHNQFIVVLPGSTRHQAIETMNRINKYLGPKIANRLASGVAEYPKDGLFLEDLVEFSMEQMEGEGRSSGFDVEVRA